VLLITVDTLRADHLRCYGFPFASSPQIDRLAAASVVFERAIAGSSSTAPSHASILTSLYTRQHTIGFRNGDSRLEGVPTLATVLHSSGYRTAAFVSNVVLIRGRGFETGFDVYDDDLPTPEQNRGEIRERIAEETTARALAWLKDPRPGPFFIWVHYQDPHGPYMPPPAYRGRFFLPRRLAQVPLSVLRDNTGIDGIPAYQVLGDIREPNVYESRYTDEIFYADESIGRLLEAVDRAAGPRGAMVLLTADHGESFGEGHEYFVHRTTTPEVAHIPMILRAPGLSPRREAGLVHHVDIVPTLLELAKIAIPEHLSGMALGPTLRESRPLPDRTVFTDIGADTSAYMRTGFVRIEGAQAAWRHRPEDRVGALAARSRRYAWSGQGSWDPTGASEPLPEEVRRYLREAVPIRMAQTATPQDLERLRALGYLEDLPQQAPASPER